MSTIASSLGLAFPGQGIHFAGMGEAALAAGPQARDAIIEASDHLGYDIAAVMADPARVDRLEFAQPAILVCSVATARAALAAGLPAGLVVGHSLGEYAAMVVSGALPFADALDLVAVRAQATAEVAARIPGAMSALLGVAVEEARALCGEIGGVWVANDNCPGQVVVSGHLESVEALEVIAAERGLRASRLAVAGSFHSPLMAPAAERMREAVAGVGFQAPAIAFLSSTTARLEDEPERLAELLVDQLTGPVRFTETIALAHERGLRQLLECGPKPVLAGLVRRMGLGIENLKTPRASAGAVR